METVVDCRNAAPPERVERFIPAFSALSPGAGLLLVSGDNAHPILELLQDRFSGQFEWYPLLDGPEEWRIVVAKRQLGAPATRYVREFMSTDHGRIHELMDEIAHTMESGDAKRAEMLVTHLATGLRKHMAMEEDLLFPVITRQIGTPRGPAAVLRDQHLVVLEQLTAIQQHTQSDQPTRDLLGELRQTLEYHEKMEEHILYATCDLLMSDEEKGELIKACQRV